MSVAGTRPWGYSVGDESFSEGMQEISSQVEFLLAQPEGARSLAGAIFRAP